MSRISWLSILIGAIVQAPLFFAWLAGMIVAIMRWGRHPRTSALAIAGFGTGLAVQVVMNLFYWFVMPLLWASHMTEPQFQTMRLVDFGIGLICSLLSVAGFALLIAAILLDRSRTRRETP